MPCSPLVPSVVITIDVLELYRVANLRSPHLSIQPFVKTLCDLHGVSQGTCISLVTTHPFIRSHTIDTSITSSQSPSISILQSDLLCTTACNLPLVEIVLTGACVTHAPHAPTNSRTRTIYYFHYCSPWTAMTHSNEPFDKFWVRTICQGQVPSILTLAPLTTTFISPVSMSTSGPMKPLRILWPLRGRYAFDVVKLLYIMLISNHRTMTTTIHALIGGGT